MIIGITGRIASGKSEAADYLVRHHKFFLFDADKEAAYLTAEPPITARILAAFPEAADTNGRLCRTQLRDLVFSHGARLRELESILYPLLQDEAVGFVSLTRKRNGSGLIDAPLLFRAGLERHCDHILYIEADRNTRRARYLQRPSVSEENFDAIEKSQEDITDCRDKCDIVIDGGQSLTDLHRQLDAAINTMSHT